MVTQKLAGCLLISLALAAFGAFAQDAQLSASVDRDIIRANESFTFVLRAEGRFSGIPDVSALTRDFDILQTGSSTSIRIVNGQRTQVAEWQVELMPRSDGNFEIPPIEMSGVLSNPVLVEVLPAATGADADADIFVEVSLDRQEAYVQAQVVYMQRFFIGINTSREELTSPLVEGGDAIVEKLGGDREFQTVRGERVYRVRERRFAIFPQSAGTITIGPTEYRATVIPLRGFSRRQGVTSESLSLTVLPAVPPPASHPSAIWLPAQSLRIEESWGDGELTFEQGVPRTRQLSVVADGLLETQLPEITLAQSDGLRQYADQPELSRQVRDDGIEATRTERFAVIAQQPGAVEFPPVELPWWNVDTRRWEVARVPAVTAEVIPGDVAPAPEPIESVAQAEPVYETESGFWPWLSAALALGWALSLAVFVWMRRSGRSLRRQKAPTRDNRPSGRALTRQLAAACQVHDPHRAQELLLLWGERQFSDDPPASLGALAQRLKGPLAAEIRALESALYGREAGSWDGKQLAEMIRKSQSVRPDAGSNDQDPLIPLYR
jgi:hypothetical protein